MAAAWPAIEFLSVRGRAYPKGLTILPSITSLVAFAGRCHVLEVLRLCVGEVGFEELQALEDFVDGGDHGKDKNGGLETGGTGGGQRLTQLHIADRELSEELLIADVPRLAAALHRMFPHLRRGLEGGRRRTVVDLEDEDVWMDPLETSDAYTLLVELDRLHLIDRKRNSTWEPR